VQAIRASQSDLERALQAVGFEKYLPDYILNLATGCKAPR
jgi:hypothetical protein